MPNITIVHAFFAKLMLVEVTLTFVNAMLSENCVWWGGGGVQMVCVNFMIKLYANKYIFII